MSEADRWDFSASRPRNSANLEFASMVVLAPKVEADYQARSVTIPVACGFQIEQLVLTTVKHRNARGLSNFDAGVQKLQPELAKRDT
jgi:hypothetical protein